MNIVLTYDCYAKISEVVGRRVAEYPNYFFKTTNCAWPQDFFFKTLTYFYPSNLSTEYEFLQYN